MSLNQQIDAHKVHAGWLYKKGWYNTSWKRRFFVLYDDRTIHYFTKESHAKTRTKAKGKIHLTQIRRVELVVYNDPKNKNNCSPSMSMLKRKSSLPIHLSQSYQVTPTHSNASTPKKSTANHKRKSKSVTNIPLSPPHTGNFSFQNPPPQYNPMLAHIHSHPMLTPTRSSPNTHSRTHTNKSKKQNCQKQKSKTPTDSTKSFEYTKPTLKKERAQSAHFPLQQNKSNSPQSNSGVSPLQSINEKESVEAVTSLAAYTMNNNYFSAATPSPRLSASPRLSPSAINGINGWSFNGMSDINDMDLAGAYYSTRSNIVSSAQPMPDYTPNIALPNEETFEKQRRELDQSLQALTDHKYSAYRHKYRQSTKNNTNIESTNQKPRKRPPVPITRRTRNRTQSATAAEITRDISHLNINNDMCSANYMSTLSLNLKTNTNNNNNSQIRKRTRSASCVNIQPLQPLTLMSSSTTTFQTREISKSRTRSESMGSVKSVHSTTTETMQASDRSLTPYHSLISVGTVETVECELSDEGSTHSQSHSTDMIHSSFGSNVSSDYMAGYGMSNGTKRNRYDMDKNVILSQDIRMSHQDSLSMFSTDNECDFSESKKDEFDIFQTVMDDTQLGLSCNRRYSFSLIHPNREYILSAESNQDCKEWISIFSKLVQGKSIHSGKLALKHHKKDNIWHKKFFVLFENKVLNYYKDKTDVNNGNACEFDIDLRHVMWLRYCSKNEFVNIDFNQCFGDESPTEPNYYCTPAGNSVINPFDRNIYSLEIAIPNRLFIMTAETQRVRNEWYNQIRSVFSDTLILKRYFDSAVTNIYFVHSESSFRDRYIALFQDILVVFQKKSILDNIKRMTFFDEVRFRDYIRKKHCTIIPINNDVRVRRAKTIKHGKYAFVVINCADDRKWYFNCEKKEDLEQWIRLLVDKRKKHKNKTKHKKAKNNNYLSPPTAPIQRKKAKKKGRAKGKIKPRSCDMFVESPFGKTSQSTVSNSSNNSETRATMVNKRELRDNNSVKSNIDAAINEFVPDNYDLSLVSSDTKESPIPNTNISNMRHSRNLLPYAYANLTNKSRNRYTVGINRAREGNTDMKLVRSTSEDCSEDCRQSPVYHKGKIQRKQRRSASVDAQDLSPKHKSKRRHPRSNLQFDKILHK